MNIEFIAYICESDGVPVNARVNKIQIFLDHEPQVGDYICYASVVYIVQKRLTFTRNRDPTYARRLVLKKLKPEEQVFGPFFFKDGSVPDLIIK